MYYVAIDATKFQGNEGYWVVLTFPPPSLRHLNMLIGPDMRMKHKIPYPRWFEEPEHPLSPNLCTSPIQTPYRRKTLGDEKWSHRNHRIFDFFCFFILNNVGYLQFFDIYQHFWLMSEKPGLYALFREKGVEGVEKVIGVGEKF